MNLFGFQCCTNPFGKRKKHTRSIGAEVPNGRGEKKLLKVWNTFKTQEPGGRSVVVERQSGCNKVIDCLVGAFKRNSLQNSVSFCCCCHGAGPCDVPIGRLFRNGTAAAIPGKDQESLMFSSRRSMALNCELLTLQPCEKLMLLLLFGCRSLTISMGLAQHLLSMNSNVPGMRGMMLPWLARSKHPTKQQITAFGSSCTAMVLSKKPKLLQPRHFLLLVLERRSCAISANTERCPEDQVSMKRHKGGSIPTHL